VGGVGLLFLKLSPMPFVSCSAFPSRLRPITDRFDLRRLFRFDFTHHSTKHTRFFHYVIWFGAELKDRTEEVENKKVRYTTEH